MRIRAAVLRAVGAPFEVLDVDLSQPQAGEVLVKVSAVGVCHSDWHLVTGDTRHPMPLVAGHEGAGFVEAVGPGVTSVAPGELVALSWAPSCGACYYCLRDRPALCEAYVGPIWAGTMIDGTTRLSIEAEPLYHYSALACFADYCVVPAQCCVGMPGGTDPEIAAVIGCAVATGVGSVLNTARVEPGASVVVIGAGGVGLSTVMGARLAGASPILAVDPSPGRRQAALDLGADLAIDPVGEDLVIAVRSITGGRGSDYVFEGVGAPALQEQALSLARPGGTVVFSGLAPVGSATNLPGAAIVRQEKRITGSYYGSVSPARDFPLLAELHGAGRLPIERLVSHRYPLDQINEAYADMLSGRSVRGLITF